ncbi:hypothetical protein KFK09_026445 [Dendrobium nobile]|uniref:DUF4283 domain-containing protein n=1 Tax=Dendrobium nobile TaxID=94219 RepID=A0A8T3A7W8_DENNO|nr:hypothetical protein KFK09_026445 [Dendrobium nobile]
MSLSAGLVLKVNESLCNKKLLLGRNFLSDVENLDQEVPIEVDSVQEQVNKEGNDKKGNPKDEFVEAWKKPQHIRHSFNNDSVEMSDDGIAVKLNAEKDIMNSNILKFSLIIKILGNKISFPMCSVELRRRWDRFGKFHMTSLGMNWILCSFKSEEAMEEVFNGGPWYVGGYIVGMDKWTTSFNLNSFKGITAPVWIRFPCLPLYCCDEKNIARIASRIGVPMYVDGNSFR